MERYAGVLALSVQGAVQAPGGGIGRVRAGHGVRIVGVNENEIGGLDAREMRLVGVHQKLCAVLVDGYREVIRHTLMKIEPSSPAKGGGEIHTFRTLTGC